MVQFRPFGPELSQEEVTVLANDNFRRVQDTLNQLNTATTNFAQTKGSVYTYTGATLPATIVSVTITTSGYPVQIVCSGDANPLSTGGWGAINLYRDSTVIGQKVQFESSAANENNPYSLSVIDTPPKGTYTYSLKIVSNSGGNVAFGENEGPIIYAIELNGVRGPQGPAGSAVSPMVFAWRPNGVTPTVAGPAILVCSTAVVNVGNAYNTSTGVFTAPKTGKYYIGFSGFKNNDATSGPLFIRKNSGAEQYRTYVSVTNAYVPMGLNALLNMNANDTADIYIGSGLTMHTNESSQLVIFYLGE